MGGQVRQHRLDHTRVYRRGRVVVQIDRPVRQARRGGKVRALDAVRCHDLARIAWGSAARLSSTRSAVTGARSRSACLVSPANTATPPTPPRLPPSISPLTAPPTPPIRPP